MEATHPQAVRRAERTTLIRPCLYEMTESDGRESVMLHEGYALSVNVSSGGMLLLMPQPPQVHQVLEVATPSCDNSKTPLPALVEVRWTKEVAVERDGSLCLAGVRFLVGSLRLSHDQIQP
jgi:hypothetical protein